jgi:F420-non-reducing hydrogenase iron-sulfur subunit
MPAKVISLVCERACDLEGHIDENGKMRDVPDSYVVKYPCSGMIQPLMIEAALKAGAEGVVVTGCVLGDCYFREGNKMIRERLLGQRPPGLKKTVDRRRVLGIWLSRVEPQKFINDVKEFAAYVGKLEPTPTDKK